MVGIAVPHGSLVVHADRETQLGILELFLKRLDVLLSFGLRRVNADYHDAFVSVIPPDTPVPRVVADAVDSTEGHEMDHDYLPLELLHGERIAVDPLGNVLEFRGLLLAWNLDGCPVLGILGILGILGVAALTGGCRES